MTEHQDKDREQQEQGQEQSFSADLRNEGEQSNPCGPEENVDKQAADVHDREETVQWPEADGSPRQQGEAQESAGRSGSVSSVPPMTGQRKPKSGLKKNLGIFAAILAGVVLLGVIGSALGSGFSSDTEWHNPKSPYLSIVYVEGGIYAGQTDSFGSAVGYQHRWTLDRIDEFIQDENNRGILLFVNSPGGGVYESDELYLKLKDYQNRTKRPVYASMGSMAASGGYYIAAAADQIYANRNTWTGSIGVTIGTLYDISDLLTRYGIKTTTITAGSNKAMGSMVEPLTQEQRDIFQSLVDDAYEQFTGIVAAEREMPLATVKTLADGRIYTAKQALDAGLIDEIGTLDEAMYALFEEYELWDCEINHVYYQDNSFFGRLFAKIDIPQGPTSDIGALLNFVDQGGKFPISYECELLK